MCWKPQVKVLTVIIFNFTENIFFFSGMRTLQCDDLQSQHILPQNGRSIANPEADRFGGGINNLLDQTISFCIC